MCSADRYSFGAPPADWTPKQSKLYFELRLVVLLGALSACNLTAQLARHLPTYEAQDRTLYAKVKMADGSALPEIPAVEAICGGVAYPLGLADTQGNFRLLMAAGGTRFNPGFNSEGDNIDLSFLANCEFRADLPGFRSRRVSPGWMREMKDANTISVGTILLLPPDESQRDSPDDPPIPKKAGDAYKKGGAALAKGKWSEAKSEFETAVSLQPAYYAAWIGIGLADEALRQWHDAEAAYQKALGLRSKSAAPYLRIARLGAKASNWEQAAQYSEAALGMHPRQLVEGYSLCALANVKLGRMDVAESSARAGLKLETANEYPELWLSMALAQASSKHYADAVTSLQTYLKLAPKAESIPALKKELLALRTLFP